MKTLRQVLEQLNRDGITISEWSRVHGFKAGQVRDVLRGKAKGRYGAAHDIAVAMGLKEGRGSSPDLNEGVLE